VLLVDKASFPSDTLSTHQIQVPGVARLASWGLLDRLRATNAPGMRRVHFDQGADLVLDGTFPDGGEIYSVRRTRLDTLLVEAAAEAGAEVRQNFRVDEILIEAGVVVGIRGSGRDGASVVERARTVVGADGHRSLVAQAVDAPRYQDRGPMTCAYYSYFADWPTSGLEIYGRARRATGLMPTNDGLTCVFTSWPHSEFHVYRADIEANFLATCEQMGLGERLRAAKRVERFYGTADLPNFFRKPFGPGWALVGDAGYVLDPITGQGIGDAFRDAELLAQAMDGRMSLATYEKKRNAAARPMFEMTTQLASFAPPPPQNVFLLKALKGNQAQTDRFFGVLTGSVPVAEFFSPLNLVRILGKLAIREAPLFRRLPAGRAGW
jgi:2-polyprenyl-6-methoxyphenol hydroxylase-like FAD-dependent oxidoreductase